MKLLGLLPVLAVACASAPEREQTAPLPAPTVAAPQGTTNAVPPSVAQDQVRSSRLREEIVDGISIIDYRATPENERAIDEILSAAGIYFHLEAQRPTGWALKPVRLDVTVDREDLDRTMKLLQNAADDGRLDVVEGYGDLIGRF